MTSRPGSRDQGQERHPSEEEEEIVEIQRGDSDTEESLESSSRSTQSQQQQQQQQQQRPERKRTSPDSPAYVAPIPRIDPIPPVPSIDNDAAVSISAPERPQLPDFVGAFLVGKRVDEYGDIVDETTGRVLGRAGGDLPSIVGRTVSNKRGDILGDEGELLGYVEDLGFDKGAGGGRSESFSGQPPWLKRFPAARSLMDIMRQSTMPLIVDPLGNILDTEGNVVGKFHDNNNPIHREQREQQQQQQEKGKEATAVADEEEKPASREQSARPSPSATPQPEPEPEQKSEQPQSERKQNAQSWRKENESPSDIFLDVKSTTEGIQLTIRIPTVFNGTPVQPRVQFS